MFNLFYIIICDIKINFKQKINEQVICNLGELYNNNRFAIQIRQESKIKFLLNDKFYNHLSVAY